MRQRIPQAYPEENGKSSMLVVFPHLDAKGPSLLSSSADGLSEFVSLAMCVLHL